MTITDIDPPAATGRTESARYGSTESARYGRYDDADRPRDDHWSRDAHGPNDGHGPNDDPGPRDDHEPRDGRTGRDYRSHVKSRRDGPGFLTRTEMWLDDRGKGAWIAAMVLGFVFFWPVGLALLFYMIWSKRMFSSSCRSSRKASRREGREIFANARAALRPSGNSTFDNYKAATLRRLEDEQQSFEAFLERLREAKDKAEFDQFMDDRARAAATPPAAAPADEARRNAPDAGDATSRQSTERRDDRDSSRDRDGSGDRDASRDRNDRGEWSGGPA